jgi:hypothetical protein
MNTFVIDSNTASMPIKDLLTRAGAGSIALFDVDGNVLAYLISPADREELIYAEARFDLEQHQEAVRSAISRRGGISTKQLLEKANAAATTKRE